MAEDASLRKGQSTVPAIEFADGFKPRMAIRAKRSFIRKSHIPFAAIACPGKQDMHYERARKTKIHIASIPLAYTKDRHAMCREGRVRG